VLLSRSKEVVRCLKEEPEFKFLARFDPFVSPLS